jgi:hypothetical protein
MEYSAVTQPLPLFRRKDGTEFSTLAAHKTRVFPNEMSAEPSAVFKYDGWISSGRRSPALLPSTRIF